MDHLDVLVLENDELRHHVTALRQLIADIIVDFEIAIQVKLFTLAFDIL